MRAAHLWILPGLSVLLACGGSTAPSQATGLDYQDPPPSGWRLSQDAALSTSTHLVLDLLAPAGAQGLGAGFKVASDGTLLTWDKVAPTDEDHVHNVAYDLGAYPQLSLGLARGATLAVGAFQKGVQAPVTYAGPLLQVAVAFQPSAGLKPGDPIPFTVVKAVHVGPDGTPTPIAVACGELRAR